MKRSILMTMSLIVLSIVAVAQPPRHKADGDRTKGTKEHFEKMAIELKLNETQKKEIHTILFSSRKIAMPLKNKLGEKEARLNTLSTADKVDMKALKSLAQEIGEIKNQLFVSRLESDQKIRAILDDQQRLKFDMQHKRQKNRKRQG